jgi:GNAT superfamily N-acetyltransferase
VPHPTIDPLHGESANARDRVHTLRDGGRILVRALRVSDRTELAARYEELSAESRRLRFFNAPEHLSGRLLDYLVDVDGVNRFALGAQAIDAPGQPGVGVARYARDRDDPTSAEAAVTVLDSYCNRGIGTILLTALVDAAREHGINTFTASVLWENHLLLDSLRAYGAVVVPDEPGVAAVSVELPRDSKELVGSALYRVLRTVAIRLGVTYGSSTDG